IGRAAAQLLATSGAQVGVVDIDAGTAGAVVAEIQASGGRAMLVAADLADPRAFAAAAAAFAGQCGRIDAVINNAMWIRYEPIDAVEPE
ncbi:SDR family NAD(P)-dependent oxidoreductase, partial [Enterobacter hormaechei]|uniref:SDR family NAD(P)-dependent oxidoreductase n=1 Tax=Enterobacter hormaechei TaxID=158836 RepID=UPI0013D741FA